MTPPGSDWSPGIITLTASGDTFEIERRLQSLTRLVRSTPDCPLSKNPNIDKVDRYVSMNRRIDRFADRMTDKPFKEHQARQSGATLGKIITCRHPGQTAQVWHLGRIFLRLNNCFFYSPSFGGFWVCTNTRAATVQIRRHKTICMLITVFRDCCVFASLSDRGGRLSPGL